MVWRWLWLVLILGVFGCSSKSVRYKLPEPIKIGIGTESVELESIELTFKSANLNQPLNYLDLLALARFCEPARRVLGPGSAIGVFHKVDGFGDVMPCLRTLAKERKLSWVRDHLAWCDDHSTSCFMRARKDIFKRAMELETFAAQNPQIQVYLSWACENRMSSAENETFLKQVRNLCPHCAGFVNSTLGRGWINGINEVHGSKASVPPGECFYSYDGQAAEDANVAADTRKFAKCGRRGAWGPGFNGKAKVDEKTPRKDRTWWADEKYLRAQQTLSTNPGFAIASGPKGAIYKPISERNGSGRGKPVIIWPARKSLVLVDARGKVLVKAGAPTPYNGGGYRSYLPKWGYEIAGQAMKQAGSRKVFIRVDGKNHGPIDAAMRAFTFRQ